MPDTENNINQEDSKAKRERLMIYLRGMSAGVLLTMIIFAVIAGVVIGRSGKEPSGADVLTSLKTRQKMGGVADLISKNYYYDADPDLLETYLFKGIAAGLDDPYAAYYSSPEREDVDRGNEGQYFGIGISFSMTDEGEMEIVDVYPGSAADKAGIKPGDIVLEVEGEPVTGLSSDEAADLISAREEAGQVTMLLDRDEEQISVTASFEMVKTSVITSRMLDAETGYICLPQFTTAAAQEFPDILKDLQEKGAKRLVLDIRDNPGGLLESVCDIFGTFRANEEIVHILRKDKQEETITTGDEAVFTGTVALLVNGRSASASELLAGGIQDLKIGPVIGEQTYGKGVIQSTYYFRDGSAVKFTTEKYLTAHRRDIDGIGVEPDVVIENMDETDQERILETALKEASEWKSE